MADQTIFPMIAYENAAMAMTWLVRAFGFIERSRMTDQQGRVVHGELELSGSVVMLASPTSEYRSPKNHAETCDQARRWSAVPWVIDGVLVMVDDVDAHYKNALAAGAMMLSGIEEGGPGRRYRAADLEGHRWMFMQKSS
jgi:PhnB protein